MMSASNNPYLTFLKRELKPAPDRLAGSLRDTLSMLLALVLSLTLRVPGAMLGLAFLFVVHRERPVHLVRTSVQLLGGCVSACVLSILYVQVTAGDAALRFLGIALWIFVAALGMQATRWPVYFVNFGFYGFLFLASWDSHLPERSIISNILFDVASLSMSLLCFILVDYAFRTRSPLQELTEESERRLKFLCAWLHRLRGGEASSSTQKLDRVQLIQVAFSKPDRLRELLEHLDNPILSVGLLQEPLRDRVLCILEMLESAALMSTMRRPLLEEAARIERILRALQGTQEPKPLNHGELSWLTPLERIESLSQRYQATFSPNYSAPPRAPEPQSVVVARLRGRLPDLMWLSAVPFALKVTLSAMLCYIVYSAVAWPALITSVTTVLFTSLTTTGSIKEKQIYRLVGSGIGGLAAGFSVAFFIPNMDTISELVILVSPVVFLSAWILRSPRIGYMGLQIAYTFFVTLIGGFTAPTSFAPARDRIIGIVVGCLIMWIIFELVWPVRSRSVLLQSFELVTAASTELSAANFDDEEYARLLASEVAARVGQVNALVDAAGFDFGRRDQAERRSVLRLAVGVTRESERFFEILRQAIHDRPERARRS